MTRRMVAFDMSVVAVVAFEAYFVFHLTVFATIYIGLVAEICYLFWVFPPFVDPTNSSD